MATRLTQPKTRDRSTPEKVGLPTNSKTKGGKLYIYAHAPEGWYWTDKPGPDGERLGWLPRPSNIPAHPGVNGVRDPGGRRPVQREHISSLLGGLQSKGFMLLMPEDARLGPYQFYDRYYETQDGGKYYVEPGQEVAVLPNGTLLWNSDDVGDTIIEFHRYLRDEAPDMVHPLMREIWQQFMGREQERLGRYIQAAGMTPGLGYRVEAQQQKIAQMTEDYERYEASLEHGSMVVHPATNRAAEEQDEEPAAPAKRGRGVKLKPAQEPA